MHIVQMENVTVTTVLRVILTRNAPRLTMIPVRMSPVERTLTVLTVRAIVTQATKEMLIPAVQNQTHVMTSPAVQTLIARMARVIVTMGMRVTLTQVVQNLILVIM